jgi:drug/metabolite transporter (DMT)-like permease
MSRSIQATLLLLLVTAIWGAGFVVTARTLQQMHPLWSNALRFWLAVPLALALFGRRIPRDREGLRGAATAGVLLSLAFAFQTWGLSLTTVSHSSLITGMYAVFTPLLSPLFRAPRPNAHHLWGAAVAVAGLALLVGGGPNGLEGSFGVGDVLTLGCAVVSAFHIHVVGKVAPGRDPMGLNTVQMMACALVNTAAALALAGPPPLVLPWETWAMLLFLAVFSSVLAFGIQLSAQQVLSTSTASVLMLMESPLGALAGVVFQGDTFNVAQLSGGGFMMAGAVMAVRADQLPAPPPTRR